jgi:hypothetical protein
MYFMTKWCQAQSGAMFDDARQGSLPGWHPEEVVEHLL